MHGYSMTPHRMVLTATREELCEVLRLLAAACVRQEGMTAGLSRMLDRKVEHITPVSPMSAILDAINDTLMISRDVHASAELYREIMETPDHPQAELPPY